MKKAKEKIKKIYIIVVIMCMFACLKLPLDVEAAEASASGATGTTSDMVFVDEPIDVKVTVTGKSGAGKVVPSDIALIMDRSGSMSGKIDSLKTAASSFIDKIDTSVHRIGIVSYSDSTDTVDFSTDKTELKAAITNMQASGGTDAAKAINAAVDMLKNNRRENVKPVIVILTDGQFDQSAAATAAKVAIDNDFTFYTIALLDNVDNAIVPGTSDYAINQQLMSMATSAKYHYSVGVDTLQQAYSDIASEVGKENPYNLVVTEILDEHFEIVPGSADTNIPKPVISGQTISWSMKELAGKEEFSYQIRAKAGTPAGVYDNAISGNVYYETYEGNAKNVPISTRRITLLDTSLNVETYSPDQGEVGKAQKVMVRGKDFHFKSDFYVTVGGEQVSLSNVTTTTFAFKVPTDLASGTYEILAYNSATPQKIGEYTYTELPKEETLLNVSRIDPDNGEEGEVVYAWVYGTDMQYETNFKVMIDNQEVRASNFSTSKFKLKIPNTLAEGMYDVIVYNGKDASGQIIGQFTVGDKKPVTHNLSVSSITPSQGEEGTQVYMWVYGTDMSREAEFRVEIGGIEVPVSNFSARKFKIKSPVTLAVGDYDIMVYNGTGAQGQKIGTYTVTQKLPIVHNLAVSHIDPSQGEEGTQVYMWVYGTDMSRESEFKVEIGGIEVPVSNFSARKFKIKSPVGLKVGDYDIMVYNGAGAQGQKIGTYKVTASVVEDHSLNISTVQATGTQGKTSYVWIYGKNMEYEQEFRVEVGGVEVNASNRSSSKFKLRMPNTLSQGTYEIIVYNGKNASGQKIGTYVVQ